MRWLGMAKLCRAFCLVVSASLLAMAQNPPDQFGQEFVLQTVDNVAGLVRDIYFDPPLAGKIAYILRRRATNGHHAIAKLLQEHGASSNSEVESSADALSRAISNNDQPMIELLCSYGASRAVHLLAYDGDIRMAAAVFAADPKLADDQTSLANAAGEGHEAFVRLMLRYQPDLPNRMTFPAWSVGAKTHTLNKLLIENGMNPSQPDWLMITALHQFARNGNVERARQYLDEGADIDARDEDICSTPLGWAAKFGQLEIAELLIERGARTNLPDDPPWATPLAWASRRDNSKLADLLHNRGAR